MMGMFGWGKKQRKPRGANKPAEERRIRAEAAERELRTRAIKQAIGRNPTLVDEIAREALRRDFGVGGKDEGDETDKMIARFEKMKKAGFLPNINPKNETMEDIGTIAGGIIKMMTDAKQNNQGQANQQMAQTLIAMQQQVAQLQQQLGQTPNPAAPPVIEESPTEPQAEGRMTLIAQMVILNLDKRTPEEGADWLVTLPGTNTLPTVLAETPDDHLLVLLQDFVGKYPDLSPVVAWLRQRPDYTVALARALRKKASPSNAQPGAGHNPPMPTDALGSMGL